MREPFYHDAVNGITLYHGDARDILPELDLSTYQTGSVDLYFTDPPYGMQFAGQGQTTQQANVKGDGARQGVRLVRQVLFEIMGLAHPSCHLLMFCHRESWPDFYDAASGYFNIKNALIWWKDRGGMGDTEMEYARDYEVILFGANGRRKITGRRDGALLKGFYPVGNDRDHPTEKPIDLCAHLIEKHCPPGGLVVDTFAGVGPVLQAAKMTGRKAIGIELSLDYCVKARDRLVGTMAHAPPAPKSPGPTQRMLMDELVAAGGA